MKRASTSLTPEEMAQLDRIAKARGVARAALLRDLVADLLSGRVDRPKRMPAFDLGGPIDCEERDRIIDEAYQRRADRR